MKFHRQWNQGYIHYDDSKSPWIEMTESNGPPIRIAVSELDGVIDTLSDLYQQLREAQAIEQEL
jgi:hypothetical protein